MSGPVATLLFLTVAKSRFTQPLKRLLLLLEYTLPTPALTQTNGVATFQGVPYTDDTLADGTAADYTIETSGGTVHITGTNEISTVTAGTGSLQINATSTALTTGQTVEAPGPITLTFPASDLMAARDRTLRAQTRRIEESAQSEQFRRAIEQPALCGMATTATKSWVLLVVCRFVA